MDEEDVEKKLKVIFGIGCKQSSKIEKVYTIFFYIVLIFMLSGALIYLMDLLI